MATVAHDGLNVRSISMELGARNNTAMPNNIQHTPTPVSTSSMTDQGL
jgi:hypothetical protein